MEEFLKEIADALWGYPMIILLLGTHLYLTVLLRFPQLKIWTAIKLSVTKDKGSHGDVSQFESLATALAATIGTGNIIGVATAIALGGPGAVLWCWFTGVFGIATKYAESLLSVKYRMKNERGQMVGGPMYVLEKGLKMKWLGVLFAIFTVFATFGIGSTVQVNSIALLANETFGLPFHVTGIVVTLLVAVVILLGIKGIAKVCSYLVPFMAIFYIIGCLIILIINAEYLPETIGLIVRSAFTSEAVGGGFVGTTVLMTCRYGIARGLFSNESGMGAAPIVSAATQTRNPVRQALVAASGTFWDTVVVCALTGLVLVSTCIAPNGIDATQGAALTHAAFGTIPVIGPLVLTVGIFTFAFSTILGWSYYGEKSMEYLFGYKAVLPFRLIYIVVVFLGSILNLSVVWTFSDIANGLMCIPNLIAVLLLSKVLVSETKKYLWSGNLDAEEKNLE